ncbi:MAG: GNAT family N-acetyltransferase [Fimbriimonadaceae bacterium]|nr:GNAT family N-acetyltransferase [Fimbriimonadaceae bacterium]
MDDFSLALDNLSETYVALAEATPGTSIQREGDVVVAQGDLAHPICNFALLDRTEVTDAGRLARLAADRPYLNLYVPMPGHGPVERRLRKTGLRCVHVLEVMVAPGRVLGDQGRLVLLETETPEDRTRVARFMADQFFGRYQETMREGIARSTADASTMRLYGTPDCERPFGAVLLTETPGALGLYNLCVRLEERGQGLGSEIVRWVLAAARARGERVTLQCDDRLAGWYRRFGFVTVGRLGVFSSSR